MEEIIQLDWSLFQLIHFELKNDICDFLLPILRERNIWIPLYVFIVGFVFYTKSLSKAIFFILGLVVTVAITDVVSSQAIKKSFKRARPCHVHEDYRQITPLVQCGSGYSFPSSHAANHFAIAFFLILGGFSDRKWVNRGFVIWASAISFAQIYVGLHFPFDVIGGMILGSIIAMCIVRFSNWATAKLL